LEDATMKLKRAGDSREFVVEILSREGSTLNARVGEDDITATYVPGVTGGGVLTIGERRYRVFSARRKDSTLVAVGAASFEFKTADSAGHRRAGGLAAPEITAPMPGKVLKVMVAAGDRVEAGQPLVVIEAMKMETALSAENAAIVSQVRVAVGQMVDHGAVLIELSPLPQAPVPSTPQSAP
jgi:3-methylcrotonyl-CoA carboxylase alpha subunit